MGYYQETGNQARAWFNKWTSSPHWNLGGSTVLMAPSEWKRLFEQGDPIALVNNEPIFFSLWGEPGEKEEWWVGNNLSASWNSVGTEFPTIESVLEVMIEVSKRHLERAKWVAEEIKTFAIYGHTSPLWRNPIRQLTPDGKLVPIKADK